MTRSPRSRPGLIAALLAAAVTSCGGLLPDGDRQRAQTVYTLDPELQLTRRDAGNACALVVATPTAASGYATGRMAYVEQPFRLDYFAYHRWADSPARMLEPLLIEALEGSGLFRHIVASPAVVDADYRLETEIVELAQHFPGGGSEVRLHVRFRLVDLSDQKLLFSETFRVREIAPEASPYGGAVAANRATAALLRRLTEKIATTLPADPSCRLESET